MIPLLAKTGADIPLHLETKNYRDFSGPSGIRSNSVNSGEDIRTGRNAVVLKEEYKATRYVTVPPLPRNYIDGPEELRSLRNAVIAEEPGPRSHSRLWRAWAASAKPSWPRR